MAVVTMVEAVVVVAMHTTGDFVVGQYLWQRRFCARKPYEAIAFRLDDVILNHLLIN